VRPHRLARAIHSAEQRIQRKTGEGTGIQPQTASGLEKIYATLFRFSDANSLRTWCLSLAAGRMTGSHATRDTALSKRAFVQGDLGGCQNIPVDPTGKGRRLLTRAGSKVSEGGVYSNVPYARMI